MPRSGTQTIPRPLRRIAAGSLAVVALAAAFGMPGGGSPAAELTASPADGTLAISNSLAGQAILTVSDMAPGSSTSGAVRIGNSGTLESELSLSQTSITDTPGPGGRPLSERLALRIEDVSRGATVYAGPLAGTGTIALGAFPAGSARNYRFTLTFGAATDDNAYQASAVSVGYDWSATPPGPPPADPNALGAPRPRLGLRVRVGSLWGIVRDRRFVVRVSCRVPCRTCARTSFELGGRRLLALPEVRSRRAARSARLTVRLSAAAAARLWRAVSRARPVKLRLRVDARAPGRRSAANIRSIRLTAGRSATASGLRQTAQVPITGP